MGLSLFLMACITPYHVKNPRYTGTGSSERYVPVPCGKCPACLNRRTGAWSFRLLQEDKVSQSALFVTFTYDSDNVNISPRGYMTLCKRDWQLFMKRLRKVSPKKPKIKYYCAGEYGSQTFRPHFHAIMFNADRGRVERCWTHGLTYFGTVSGASIGYCAKYINKGKLIPMHAKDDRVPECALMSKGMGKNYLTPAMVDWHRTDLSRNYVVLEGGTKASLPRYYRERLYDESMRHEQSLYCQEKSNLREKSSEEEYFSIHGTMVGYERQVFHRKNAALERFKAEQTSKRNKI